MQHYSQGKWLRSSIAEDGISLAEFARRAGVSRDALSTWLTQETMAIRLDVAVKVLRALGYEPGEWLRQSDALKASLTEAADHGVPTGPRLISLAMSPARGSARGQRREQQTIVGLGAPNASRSQPPQATLEIPLCELSVAAGPWTNVTREGGFLADTDSPLGLFRVRIAGRSMSPGWEELQVVEFSCLRDAMQPLEPGRDYYVQRKDGMATFKRLDRDGEKELVFRAINRAQFPSPLGAQRGRIARIALAVGTFISVEDDGKMR